MQIAVIIAATPSVISGLGAAHLGKVRVDGAERGDRHAGGPSASSPPAGLLRCDHSIHLVEVEVTEQGRDGSLNAKDNFCPGLGWASRYSVTGYDLRMVRLGGEWHVG
jgi:hypothetical protein